MAWFRPMGADEVAYHQATVVGRGDDHPGAALAYYGSRGETPLRWGGAGAARLGLAGEVTPEAYEAAFGPRGFRDRMTGRPLVATRRPGFELVVSAHKSVAVLGVMDRADQMHSILDVETAATMAWLDDWVQERGGRRGRDQIRTATAGLTYAVTRHATSRAGDPSPHDHVLVANLVEMLDTKGGHKGLDSAALRDTVEAATMVGRLHAAARAVELGFDIEPDNGPSGNLRHWRIVGIPAEACEVFSKRSDEIAEHLARTGWYSHRARGIAARATRAIKRHTGADELLPAWRAELAEIGWPIERLADHLIAAQRPTRTLAFPLTDDEIDAIAADVLGADGALLANHKMFSRTNLVSEVAPRLYGRNPAELDRVVGRMLASPEVVPLIGVAGAREQSFTTVQVLAAEATIAEVVERLAGSAGPSIDADHLARSIAASETTGRSLTAGQRRAVEQLCSGTGSVSLVVGVAGSGKTAALEVAVDAMESAGYRVLGTSTSGQAARTLGAEADIESRTFASMIRGLDAGQLVLDDRTVVIVDETGMADDRHLACVAKAVERAGAALVLVGDPLQLPAVGPGGALRGILDRHPDLVVTLDENIRQRDPAERTALADLRNGSVPDAIEWYAGSGRIHASPAHTETLVAMAGAWAQDVGHGHDTALLAWRRADVEHLNRLARDHWDRLGHLTGPDVEVTSGRRYAVGERVIALAPNRTAGIVTSEPLVVVGAEPGQLDLRRADGTVVRLAGDQVDTQHLDYGYALTVHRTQGATCERAHVLAAGGGRELAYVAMSRARERSDVYVTADDLDQAREDLTADWSRNRHQRWITDTPARPGVEAPPRRGAPPPPRSDHVERALSPSDRRAAAEQQVAALEADYRALVNGEGRWANTPVGVAARSLEDARDDLARTQRQATDPGARRRVRRAAARAIPDLEDRLHSAEARWNEIGEPHARNLRQQVHAARRSVQSAEAEQMVERLDRLHQRGPRLGLDRGLGLGL